MELRLKQLCFMLMPQKILISQLDYMFMLIKTHSNGFLEKINQIMIFEQRVIQLRKQGYSFPLTS